ncbi:aminotransferase class V-fold PLP-dependent enzyme [bacterium]|nr:aminotransferase class V-fold PLP-dependent enzyme [bacterium]
MSDASAQAHDKAEPQDFSRHFEVPEGIYLLAHSAGALTRDGRAGSEQFMAQWATLGADAWGPWLEGVQRFREALPLVAGGQWQDFCPMPSVGAGLLKVLSCLPPGAGLARPGRSRIVLTELDFPSMGFILQTLEARGYSLSFVQPLPDGRMPFEQWEALLGEDVELLHITHSYSDHSFQPPVAALLGRARELGISTVVDAAQSIGLLPIDVEAWDSDFVTGSCLKWLCSGPGAGFLWVNPRHRGRLEPLDRGWFSHREPFEWDIHHFEYHPDAQRFWGGTVSPQPFAIAAASIARIAQIGTDTIRSHNLALSEALIEGALELGLPLSSPRAVEERGGTVVLHLAEDDPRLQALARGGVRFDRRRRYGIRLSPHIYNTLPQMRQVLQYLAARP